MELGTAKLCITPKEPLHLCGYANRIGNYSSIKDDIYLRIQIHKEGNRKIVFIYGDLIWWGSDFVDDIRKCLWVQFKMKAEELYFIASHNHSGPPTGDRFTKLLETYDSGYADYLKKAIRKGIEQALFNMEEVTGIFFEGESRLNVFRRVGVDNEIKMRPNYQTKADSTLSIVGFYSKENQLKGIMIHYPCHANLSNENELHADYPGIVLSKLDQENKGCTSIFLQGCTADLRPNSVLGDEFVPCDYEKVKLFANLFYQDCRKLLASHGKLLNPDLITKRVALKLPMENTRTLDEVQSMLLSDQEVKRQWAYKVLEKENRPYEILEISKLIYGDHLSIYTFNGEVSQYYAQFARTLHESVLCVGYTNGMIGYLCTKQQILEGGYEPIGSALYFALSGTYKPEIEDLIHKNMIQM